MITKFKIYEVGAPWSNWQDDEYNYSPTPSPMPGLYKPEDLKIGGYYKVNTFFQKEIKVEKIDFPNDGAYVRFGNGDKMWIRIAKIFQRELTDDEIAEYESKKFNL